MAIPEINATPQRNEKLAPELLSTNPRHIEGMSVCAKLDEVESSTADCEEIIRSTLEALAYEEDLVDTWIIEDKGEFVGWLWQALSTPCTSYRDHASAASAQNIIPGTPEYEWWVGARSLSSLLPKLSAFELHAVATQSSVLADASRSHGILCLLICVYALRQCPSPLEKRWKRWQSLVCETIRTFQSYCLETGHHAPPLWIRHIVPACLHVVQQLPSEALHTALVSGIIGTTSTLVANVCTLTEQCHPKALLSQVLDFLECSRTIVEALGEAEHWIWFHPWRTQNPKPVLAEQDEDYDFLYNRDNIAWWSKEFLRHEKSAGMDTGWNELGISVLAMMAFDDRNLVYTPTYAWKIWFPHVSILLKNSGEGIMLGKMPMLFLDNLCKSCPEHSLPTVSSSYKKADAPYTTFQLLSNRIMVKPQKKGSIQSSKEAELESKVRSERMVGLMKSLLTRYLPINQIKIVRKLVHDCPQPGLQAKFMDLLRPLIFDDECADAFWSFIGSFVKNLLAHVDKESKELVETNDLIEKVELYVGAVTILQLWCMVKGKLPKKIKGHPLGRFYKILKRMIESWMNDKLTMPPDDYYRLYLLEGALQQVSQILDDAHQTRKQFRDDSSQASSYVTVEPEADTESESKPKQEVIVGDADIFL